jgi:hypothetical protein
MRIIFNISFFVALLALTGSAAFALDKEVLQGRMAVLIEPAFSVNKSRTAVLIMDYENDIVSKIPQDARAALLERASVVLKEARKAKLPIIYVVVRFREGYPDVNLQNKLFRDLKE